MTITRLAIVVCGLLVVVSSSGCENRELGGATTEAQTADGSIRSCFLPGQDSGVPGEILTRDLPAGACRSPDRCEVTAFDWCPDTSIGYAQHNVADYLCDCVSGQWSCTIVSRTRAGCLSPADAGNDGT